MAEPDILEAIAGLAASKSYLPKDRYHDFNRVLLGSEEGKRVLREILSWGRLFAPSLMGKPIDPYAMAVREGERNMALRLLATVYNEPPERPTQALNKREE
jgi:hypothetical protein